VPSLADRVRREERAPRRANLRMMVRMLSVVLAGAALAAAAGGVRTRDPVEPLGEPVLEPPTLRSLGLYWILRGDASRSARVEVQYRKRGTTRWLAGPPLFRVESGAHQAGRHPSGVAAPADCWLFAGSIVMLEPDTSYELALRLRRPGGDAERRLEARTIAEPVASVAMRRLVVAPARGLRGGEGTESHPLRGLEAARVVARPGDLFLLRPGVYEGTFAAQRSGEPGRPIIWRAAAGGEVILDGQGGAATRPGRVVDAVGIHDVWFEGLTIRNAQYGVVAHDSSRLVVRRCHIHRVAFGIAATRNQRDATNELFIADNTIEGPSTWPRTRGIEDARGIQVTGTGHVVCYNRIRGFGDAIDTFPSPRCSAIDFHNNDIQEMTDDGIEMDYSERNTRCFLNRFTNVFQGISVQPVYGGPVYIFRNALYNVAFEPFKMHNSPSGALMIHNTCVKKGSPLLVWTPAPVHNCFSRNNLFMGTDGRCACDFDPPMVNCDFDYDGFGGGPWPFFLKWNDARYPTLDEVRRSAPVYRHAVQVDAAAIFASGLRPPADEKTAFDPARVDLRLRPGSNAADAGQILPGFNDGFTGKGPDLGAYELGIELPHYGPRG
jgi:hypothetical protein